MQKRRERKPKKRRRKKQKTRRKPKVNAQCRDKYVTSNLGRIQGKGELPFSRAHWSSGARIMEWRWGWEFGEWRWTAKMKTTVLQERAHWRHDGGEDAANVINKKPKVLRRWVHHVSRAERLSILRSHGIYRRTTQCVTSLPITTASEESHPISEATSRVTDDPIYLTTVRAPIPRKSLSAIVPVFTRQRGSNVRQSEKRVFRLFTAKYEVCNDDF